LANDGLKTCQILIWLKPSQTSLFERINFKTQ